jgi:hypothetical protein
MPKLISLTLITFSLLASPATTLADLPGLENCTAWISAAAEGAVVYTLPNGHGHSFNAAHLPDGTIVDATITLEMLDYAGNPIFGFPAEDIWLDTSAGGLSYPASGTIADDHTDANGRTQWQQPLAAGGCTIGETVIVFIMGMPLNQAGLQLAFVSADINGDLALNISDLSTFAAAYTGAYNDCADLFHDGVMNLTDLSLFAAAYMGF